MQTVQSCTQHRQHSSLNVCARKCLSLIHHTLVQTAQAFSLACIAQAQALTVLRAVQKGNAPTLIAALATDASAAFKSAAGTAGGVVSGGKADSKFVLYCEYQAAAMETVALAFTGGYPNPLCHARDYPPRLARCGQERTVEELP